MKTKIIGFTLALSLVSAAFCLAAASPQMGTWKLNASKSKIAAGMGRNNMVVYAAMGDKMKVTVDGVDADGKKSHNVWTGKFDGKSYPVVGDPAADMRSYKMVSANTLELTQQKGGKVTSKGQIVVAADGKSRTVTTSGTDAKGKKFKNMSFYDKG